MRRAGNAAHQLKLHGADERGHAAALHGLSDFATRFDRRSNDYSIDQMQKAGNIFNTGPAAWEEPHFWACLGDLHSHDLVPAIDIDHLAGNSGGAVAGQKSSGGPQFIG